jgi:PhnB protein
MQMSPYLSFAGQCEEAFTHYVNCLDGTLGPLFRYEGSPMAEGAPAAWSQKIMHGSVTVGGVVVMGADIAPQQYEKPQGFSLSLQINSVADAERFFAGLAEGGKVVMPLEKTFWAARFGMVVDRFGIPWLINCDGADQA